MRKGVHTTVGAIIRVQDDSGEKILLTRRNVQPFQGRWCLPGGHIDRYETAWDAVIREVREETGLAFDPQFFNYFDEIFADRDIHHVVLMFTGTASGTLQAQESEVSETGWFSVQDALSLELAFGHAAVVGAYARSRGLLV
ncbi:MAG: NUDIX hydrolase [Gammaproteobacteria bacterium]|nr:NUDIX hydrolase [Gammaproteobacteria bacterium]MCP5423823.1 NUDIX hydrolase [Gammaproteobacteria bacterium]